MGLFEPLDRMSTKLFNLPISSKLPAVIEVGDRGTVQVEELVTKLDKLAVFTFDENKLAAILDSPAATGSSTDPIHTT
jgi:hypothetical protein